MDSSRSGLHGVRHLVLGLIVLAGLLPASAFAQYADQGEAYAACQVSGAASVANMATREPGIWPDFRCEHEPVNLRYRCDVGNIYGGWTDCGIGDLNVPRYYSYSLGCDSRQTETGWFTDSDPNTSNDVCNNGCYMAAALNLDTGQTEWYPTGDVCTESDLPPPVADSDGDGVPDDDDAFPNDPDESADSDGDGIGDNEDFAPDDSTDGEDDGTGDETDNQAGGGGTCAAPPSCAGDGIACATLYQQWETRCAIDRLAAGLNGDGSQGDGDGDEEDDNPWGEGDGSTPSFNVTNIDSQMLDMSGFMGGGSCPTWGPIEILGVSYALPQVHCDILQWIGYLVVAVALVVAARILGS